MFHQVISVLSVFFLSSFVTQSVSVSLYSSDDPLYELDISNFESFVYKKDNAWLIEFYNNWCGHCIRFAPKWKQFARDIRTWRNVVDVAVVNCNDAKNIKLCRDYGISGFPTIKIFKPFVNETEKGDNILTSTQDIDSMETDIVNYLEAYQIKPAVTKWPSLYPLEPSSIRNVANLLKYNEEFIFILEHSDSTIGKKVILDLSFKPSIVVRRSILTNEDFTDDLRTPVMNTSFVIVLKIQKNGKEEKLFEFPAGTNSTYIRDQVFLKIVGSSRSESDHIFNHKSKSKINVPLSNAVHMTDLENALRNMLYQEIGVKSEIYGDQLLALQSIIKVLKTFFPGNQPIMAYLSKLNDWVSTAKNISGEAFVQKLDELQTSNAYLPAMKDFVSCKGSEPRYRGYPCSLWTLFHTLTVNAYIMDEETVGEVLNDAMTVLPSIKNYIKYFFTCAECVENFFKMDQDIDRDDRSSDNVVLWLWTAHNKVNHRLSGDITEDPQHLKIQFPSRDMCPNCRLTNDDSEPIKWDEVQVLRFLRYFYSKRQIIGSDENRKQGSLTSGSSSTDLKLNPYFLFNLLLWILLQYLMERMGSEKA